MIETIRHIDHILFAFINKDLQNPLFDLICPVFRNQIVWYPFYLVLLFFIYRKYNSATIWILVIATLLVITSDQLSANLIKNLVQRIRPCNVPNLLSQIHILVPCGKGFSFVSSHATNHFAIAVFLIPLFGEYRKWFAPTVLIWAGFICFSQVYVGVHYPADVICGGLLGATLGYLFGSIILQKILNP